jgi:SAM-dependent methyltransferase
MTTPAEQDYVLGTHDAEIERLELQHRVWRPRVLDAWMRAGLTTGQTAVDIGCGPGWATMDLAEVVGPTGRVHAIDRSGRFLRALDSRAAARGWSHVSTHEHDLDEPGWPAVQADLAWCRWVAGFVRERRSFVNRVRDLLKPGGRLVMHEYIDYSGWRFLPDSPVFDSFVAAVIAAWREAGGEPNVGRDLPQWLAGSGFDVDVTRPILDVVTPADFIWQWPRAFVENGLDRLVEIGRLTRAQANDIWRDFLACEASPHVRMSTPVVLEIIARRRH